MAEVTRDALLQEVKQRLLRQWDENMSNVDRQLRRSVPEGATFEFNLPRSDNLAVVHMLSQEAVRLADQFYKMAHERALSDILQESTTFDPYSAMLASKTTVLPGTTKTVGRADILREYAEKRAQVSAVKEYIKSEPPFPF